MPLPDWSPKSPEWSTDTYNLLLEANVQKPGNETLEEFIKKSDTFVINFPVDTGRCKFLKDTVSKDVLERNINSVYPILHENVLELFCKFIIFKRKYGSTIEKKLYKTLTLKELIERLLKKRAAMFMSLKDKYFLLNRSKGEGNWETIGTDKETPPLILQDCMSYDEIKLSALLSVSSYTYFINKGDRKNMAKVPTSRESIADEGVIVGVIGPRLKKIGVMEYQEIVSTKNQNTKQNGYGTTVEASTHKLFSEFYEEECLEFEEMLKFKATLPDGDQRFFKLTENSWFDNYYYYKRLTISIDTLLLEANYRAEGAGKKAFVHVVGLGLGCWRISPHQERVFMDIFAKRISILGSKLSSISDICFAWILQTKCGDYSDGQTFVIKDHPLGGIKILINKRNPNEAIGAEKLLVVSYAWDGNALPGNEYWSRKLGSSGDSAAASSTQVTEIHNALINPVLCVANLRIVTATGEVVTLEKYQELIRTKRSKTKR